MRSSFVAEFDNRFVEYKRKLKKIVSFEKRILHCRGGKSEANDAFILGEGKPFLRKKRDKV